MVGVALVTFVTIFAAGRQGRRSPRRSTTTSQAAFVVQNTDGFSPFSPAAAAARARRCRASASVAPVRFGQAQASRACKGDQAVDRRRPGDVRRRSTRSSERRRRRCARSGRAAIAVDQVLRRRPRHQGRRHASRCTTPTGRSGAAVTGDVDDKARPARRPDRHQPADARRDFGEPRTRFVLRRLRPGADATQVQARSRRRSSDRFPEAEVADQQEFTDDVAGRSTSCWR